MNYNTEKAILDNTKYERGFNPPNDEYVISASMVAKDPLQNYLTIIHGTEDNDSINDSTLGSVFHLGMEEVIKRWKEKYKGLGEKVLTEKNLHMKLNNGWYLSGTSDILIRRGDGTSTIEDHKLTKIYALKMLKKDILGNDWAKQVQVLDLLNIQDNAKKIPAELALNIFCKDAKAIDMENSYERVIVPNADHQALMDEILRKTDALQKYIEEGEIPPQCEDVWPRKLKNGTVINTKCALYCSHGKAGNCPYYNPTTRDGAARLTNW